MSDKLYSRLGSRWAGLFAAVGYMGGKTIAATTQENAVSPMPRAKT